MSYGHPAEKKLFLDQMRKTWSQKKYRGSGKAKTPFYLALTKTARQQLEQLADIQGMKTTDVLEQLIRQNYAAASKQEE